MPPAWHSVFREADGSVSMTRVCLLLSTIGILGTWSLLSFIHHEVLDLPGGPVSVLIAFCGLKYAQQKGESSGPLEHSALTLPHRE